MKDIKFFRSFEKPSLAFLLNDKGVERIQFDAKRKMVFVTHTLTVNETSVFAAQTTVDLKSLAAYTMGS